MHSADLETQTAIRCLLACLELRDPATAQHSFRVAGYARCLAERMTRGRAHELDQERIASIHTGALLHDIGKIGIGDRLMFKPGKLEPDERHRFQMHPEFGHKLVRGYVGLHAVGEVIRHHHERWDGAGYPDGLCGLQIPYCARIVAVCDTYDAITSERPYARPKAYAEAAQEIRRGAGTQFDRVLVEMFLSIPEAEWIAAGR